MQPDPHGIIKRESRDGVREGPLPPPVVLIDPDPDETLPRCGLMGELLGYVLSVMACILVTGLCATVAFALVALAMYSLTLLFALMLAAAVVAFARVVAECKRGTDRGGESGPQWDIPILRLAIGVALIVVIVLAWVMA